MTKYIIFLLILFSVLPSYLGAQACCSAGVPLLGSLELPATPVGNWQFSITYELNTLEDVISGTEKLNDATRKRTVNSLLMETSYGVAPNVSLTLLLSFLQQQRKITNPHISDQVDFLRTNGIGDAVLLLKYSVIPLNIADQREVAIGIGPKLPFGQSALRLDGILIAADMQPGSGAWDGVVWGYFYQGFLPKTTANLFGTVSYRHTGKSNRDYRFGNELVTTLNIGYRTDTVFDFSLSARYRISKPDQFGGFDIPNTGGQWLSIMPGVNFKLLQNWAVRFSGQIPVYRNLTGTQLTTSHRLAASIFYTIAKSPF